MAPHRQHAQRDLLVDAIEQELRRLYLLDGPLTAPLRVRSALGSEEGLSVAQWLGQVFMPRLRQVQRSRQWGPCDELAAVATYDFEGDPRFAPLRELLARLDAEINMH